MGIISQEISSIIQSFFWAGLNLYPASASQVHGRAAKSPPLPWATWPVVHGCGDSMGLSENAVWFEIPI